MALILDSLKTPAPGVLPDPNATTDYLDSWKNLNPPQTTAPATTPTPARSTSYEPEKLTLDPATQTVQGQVQNIMGSDSPFVTQARTRANQDMNARGLINSSMALGEGEKAAYNAALPIASADANAALTVAGRNQDAANQAKQLELTGNQAMEQQELRGAQSKELAEIEAQYKQTMQSNDSAARFFSQISSSISDILKEPNIGVAQKNQLVQKQVDLLKNGLAVIGGISNLDLGGLLTFDTAAPGALQPTPVAGTPGTSPAPSPAETAKNAENWRSQPNGEGGTLYINNKTGEQIDSMEYRLRQIEGRL